MTQSITQSSKPLRRWSAEHTLTTFFVASSILIIAGAVSTYCDALRLADIHDWLRNHLNAGLATDQVRAEIANARVEQSRFCLNGHPSYLDTSNIFTRNALLLMHRVELAAKDPKDSQGILCSKIQKQLKNGIYKRQYLAMQDLAKGKKPEDVQEQMRTDLLKDNDDAVHDSLVQFRWMEGERIRVRGDMFERQLQRTLSNGLLVAILFGAAMMLMVAQKYIKARRLAEETVFASEQRIRAVADNMLDGLVAIDKQGTIVSMNSTAKGLLSSGKESVIGRNIGVLFQQQNETRQPVDFGALLKLESPRLTQCMAVPDGGSPFIAEVAIATIDSQQLDTISALVTVRDINERIMAERWRRDFVSTITTDLHKPLLEMDSAFKAIAAAGENMPTQIVEVLDIADRNTERLLGLINDLADLENLQTGTLSVNPCAVNIAQLIERSLESVRALTDSKSINISVCGKDAVSTVHADPDRIVQVLVNLLSNAVKFSPEQSTIEVSVRKEFTDDRVVFSVRDSGRGVPEPLQQTIFQRYKQADTSDAKRGTGLGLPICKMIVEQHGGQIGVKSEPDRGSEFWFSLPG